MLARRSVKILERRSVASLSMDGKTASGVLFILLTPGVAAPQLDQRIVVLVAAILVCTPFHICPHLQQRLQPQFLRASLILVLDVVQAKLASLGLH